MPFNITQSVGQGCSLSPLLFNFAIHALLCCIAAEQPTGQLTGLSVPKILLHYLQSLYTDDTHLVLHASIDTLLAAKDVLAQFANASGLAINWQKSQARWLASTDQPSATNQLDWLWKEPSDPSTMLGFSFAEGLTSNLMFDSLLLKL